MHITPQCRKVYALVLRSDVVVGGIIFWDFLRGLMYVFKDKCEQCYIFVLSYIFLARLLSQS